MTRLEPLKRRKSRYRKIEPGYTGLLLAVIDQAWRDATNRQPIGTVAAKRAAVKREAESFLQVLQWDARRNGYHPD